MPQRIEILSRNLQKFQKENLSEILHSMATGLKDIFQCNAVRVYLEDLYEGMLVCNYVTGQNQPDQHRITKYISPKESITSQAFYENSVMVSWKLPEGLTGFRNPFEEINGIKSTVVFPITYRMRPIGTLSLDWENVGKFLNEEQIGKISSFLAEHSTLIERAKQFRQTLAFSKHLDHARKKEAAWMMMRSAVNLIEKLALASVLVPASNSQPAKGESRSDDLLEILTVYGKNKDHALIYNDKDQISILDGSNLINRVVQFAPDRGLTMINPDQQAVYTANIMQEQFPRKPIASKIHLVSLYQVPKFDPETHRFICAINYYTSEPYCFTKFEKELLEEHASMVEQLILEESPIHIEIQVLSEIEELLQDKDTSLPSFLNNILAKTSELLGADCGTISLLKIIEDKPWLVVEDTQGHLVGAKSRDWKKSNILPLRVGGNDLPDDQKSLNGYCAHTARPVLVSDVQNQYMTQGFYKNLSPVIRSELAVPILFGNNVLGVINQDSFRVNHFTEEHKKILQIISSLISQKVHNLKQIEEIHQGMDVMKQEVTYRDPAVSSYYLGNVIGKSRKIHSLVKQIDTVVETIGNRMLHWSDQRQWEATMGLPSLLIIGKTGTGKEFFFNNIYSRLSEIFREQRGLDFELPIKKTNIAAYSGELTFSELFGHKKGAFTGAEASRQGILEEANGGIVFLDEIGDADPKTQVQLLRFLDTGVFYRLGENQPRYSRIFLIAATNKNLKNEIAEGRFREDLYHRLNALSFSIPPLEERQEDIEDLAIHFLGRLHNTYKDDDKQKTRPHLDAHAIAFLRSRPYRGNVRELKNILLRALLFRQGQVITEGDIKAACQEETVDLDIATTKYSPSSLDALLTQMENKEGDFWQTLYRPFKENRLTRDTVKAVIDTAKARYHTNLPGLALKLGVCDDRFRTDREEARKFMSFKNFLYKTIRISEN